VAAPGTALDRRRGARYAEYFQKLPSVQIHERIPSARPGALMSLRNGVNNSLPAPAASANSQWRGLPAPPISMARLPWKRAAHTKISVVCGPR
jgi:hypothetical protein